MEQLLVVSGRSLVKVAKIKGSSGIKGDIKIVPIFFTPNELKGLLPLCAEDTYAVLSGSFPKRIKIIDVKEKEGFLIASLSGVDTRTGSDVLKDADVYVDNTIYKDYLKKSDSIIKLVGYAVVDNVLGNIGVVKKVIRGKQNLISLDDDEEKLIPFVTELITSIDDENRIINTALPAGIFEL